MSTVLRAAALITVLTIVARIAGFGRNLVFARTVGQTCLADTYMTVNTIPNILYEIVAGGALASLVVPLLARAVARGDREQVSRTTSALLTWTILALAPLAIAVALLARPIAEVLLGSKDCAGAVEVGASMLRVFAPQVVLYGVGIVLTGVLQAHRKFGAPAAAPLLSSLVVIGAYVTYALVAGRGTGISELSAGEELILSVGTTLGVVALSLSLLVPLSRLGIRLRPTLRFPVGVASRARALAYAGVAALTAQQLSILVALLLGNAEGAPEATVTLHLQAQTIFFLPWAVFAVPIAMAAFPRLAERWDAGQLDTYRRELSGATTAVVLLCLGATAALVAGARPLARMVVQSAPGVPSVDPLTNAITGFAFGLLGYGLFALLSRGLYASGQTKTTAVACVAGWLTVIGADVALAAALPDEQRVTALAVGNSVGMTVLGVLLILTVVRRAGPRAQDGVVRVLATGGAAAVVAGALGRWVAGLVDGGGVLAAVLQAGGVGLATLAVFGVIVAAVSREALRTALRALRGGPATATDDARRVDVEV